MVDPQELQRLDRDDSAIQRDDQPSIDQEIRGGEQTPPPEGERPGEPSQNSHDNQGTLVGEEAEQEMMQMEEPGVQVPDEVSPLPEGQGELIDPVGEGEEVDQETANPLPADHPEKEAVPVTLEGAQ